MVKYIQFDGWSRCANRRMAAWNVGWNPDEATSIHAFTDGSTVPGVPEPSGVGIVLKKVEGETVLEVAEVCKASGQSLSRVHRYVGSSAVNSSASGSHYLHGLSGSYLGS